MFKAKLSVSSSTHSLTEIEGILGAPSDASGYSIGDDPRPQMPAGKRWSVWARGLAWAEGTHPGTAGLEEALQSMRSMTEALRAARSAGCDITVDVHQELDPHNVWESGIHLSSACLAWMGEVGISLGVDQYVECGWAEADVSSPTIRYEPPAETTPVELARALAGGDTHAINTATLGAAFTWPDSQADVLEAVCLSLTASTDTVLRYTGLLALAHLARRVGLTWPSAAWDAIRRLRSHPELSGVCEIAAGDLGTFGYPDPGAELA